MGKLNMKDWIGQTILNKKVISIPIMTHPGIELIGKTVHEPKLYFRRMKFQAYPVVCSQTKLPLRPWKYRH